MLNTFKVFLLRYFYRFLSDRAWRKDSIGLAHSTLHATTDEGPIALRMHNGEIDANKPLIIFFHGGGWVIGDLDTHNPVCQRLCQKTGCTVVSVDYRLAPEHVYPAAHNDALAASRWIAARLPELGPNDGTFILAGDSAGANLATCVSLALDSATRELLVGEIVIYPVTDHYSKPYLSYQQKAKGYTLTSNMMRWFWDTYLGTASATAPPPLSATPLRASNLNSLPATFLVTAEHDPLRDEGKAYADKLREAGVILQYSHYANAEHGFAASAGVTAEFNQLMDEIDGWVKTLN